ncbi:Bifunctional adenosine 5prime-phosphosulfate phosphorylase/adenylylsulfatase HINT4 [Diplonema papillatum]|nr:Bifunctional adenosine 5prime-phosphosulfate phosphorylase/adenylylsulfatase HINT4 [Diplonema papillatum]
MCRKGVEYAADGSVQKCVFCDIIAGENDTRLVFRQADVAVFCPRTKSAAVHYLSVPTAHVKNIRNLGEDKQQARELLQKLDVRDKLLTAEQRARSVAVFHVPPYNSIDHLHLHMIVGPYVSVFDSIKHQPAWWKAWTTSLDEVLSRL